MNYVYLIAFFLSSISGWAQGTLTVGLTFFPRSPGEEFCLQRIRATTSYPVISYRWSYREPQGNVFMPIAGVNSSTITASRSGDYIVTVTDGDGVTAVSGLVGTYFGKRYKPVVTAAKPVICPAGTLVLTSNDITATRTHQWFRDDVLIPGATQRTYVAMEGGNYSVVLMDAAGCLSGRATSVPITMATPPTGFIVGSASLCPGTSTTLSVSATGTQPIRYQWLRDRTLIQQATSGTYSATTSGTYQVQLTDENGCPGRPADFVLTEVAKIDVQLAPVPPVCASVGSIVSLSGTPAGGTFTGPGVSGDQFNPAQVGAGTYLIGYAVTGQLLCQRGTASQAVTVRAAPVLNLGADVSIRRGESVVLPGPDGEGYQYVWLPSGTLNDPTQARPVASPDRSITYQLRVRDSSGCTATDTIRVYVQVPVYIPTAFSPNGDGINDTWELINIADIPDVVVRIFNRWGETIFNSAGYQTPFNGRGLREGIYTYLIQYGTPATHLSGSLTLIR